MADFSGSNLMIGAASASRGWAASLSWLGWFCPSKMASFRSFCDGLDRQRAADADFAHRIGHVDTLALEGIPERQHRVALHIVQPVGVGDPEGQGKLHPGLGEFHKDAVRSFAFDGARRRRSNVERQFADQPRVGLVIGAEIHLHQRVLVGVGPVDDLLGDQVLIGDQEFAAVAGGDRNIPGLHLVDAASTVADGDEIAGFDRFIRQQDDAADEVGDDLLQAEADADTGGTEKIASAERLMPAALSTTATANTVSASRITLISSTWIDGVRSVERVIRLSTKLETRLVSHNATIKSTPSLIRSSGVSRRPPSTIETESSASMVGSSRPRMLKAATSQAASDTRRTMKGLRMTDVTRRMISHAKARLAATDNR